MLCPRLKWYSPCGFFQSSSSLVSLLEKYVNMGLTLYVGSDSMLYNNHCVFSSVIAVHSNTLDIATYFYQKQKIRDDIYKNLDSKILKEVNISLNVANFLKQNIPNASIEVHLDIGNKERNKTKYLVDSTCGWVTGMGYEVKIKPESWASSVADWHTK